MNNNGDYPGFLERKRQLDGYDGFEPLSVPDFLFDFQRILVDWSCRKGRGAIFADCGMGKTPMQLVWAQNVMRRTNKSVLIVTPLAVSYQTIREGEKFGIEVRHSQDGKVHKGITITNYERLSCFNPTDFSGMVADESSILKSFDGVRRNEITEFMRKLPYRLLCTATAAPNDYIELGTSSESLGYLGHMDMLNRFFKNDNNTSDLKGRYRGFAAPRAFIGQKFRFKGHAEIPFWRWVCSWARSIRRPFDLGCEDGDFILPPINEHEHYIETRTLAPGMLFPVPAIGLHEQREERRRTIRERCEYVASLVVNTNKPALVWCNLNDEGDMLSSMIKDGEQVRGQDSDESKEARFLAFTSGDLRVLITKPKIGAWGLNFQHCAHVILFPSHSYEQYYQGVRRCWRFGQKTPVCVDIVATEGDRAVMDNLRRKTIAADEMFSRLVEQMTSALNIERGVNFDQMEEVPEWLS
jgi:hypothetical protein